mgnify:CR=1 FL=1
MSSEIFGISKIPPVDGVGHCLKCNAVYNDPLGADQMNAILDVSNWATTEQCNTISSIEYTAEISGDTSTTSGSSITMPASILAIAVILVALV